MLITNFSSVYFPFASPFNNEKQVEFQCWGVRTGYLLNQRHLDSYHEHLRGFGSSAPAEIEMANASDSVEEFAIKNDDPEDELNKSVPRGRREQGLLALEISLARTLGI